jgi:choline dehydrogenase
LSAGVYGTPAILQRSGVGSEVLLSAFGIETVANLAGVGENLHDHPMLHVGRRVKPELQAWLDDAAASGFLPEEQTLGKFISDQSTNAIFDLHLFPVVWNNQTSLVSGNAVIEVACMTPQSRGSLRITSPDPSAHPRIDHGYLSDPGGHDLAVMRDGLRLADEMLNHPLLAHLLGEPINNCSTDGAIRRQVAHYYHPVGTCRMGHDTDPLAVCDGRGRVIGLSNVVVADASLMPQIPRANTNLPAIMIGERIAQFLL